MDKIEQITVDDIVYDVHDAELAKVVVKLSALILKQKI